MPNAATLAATRLRDAIESETQPGLCLCCGDEHDHVPLDTEAERCCQCGEFALYGALALWRRYQA